MDKITEPDFHVKELHAWERVKHALRRDWDQTKYDFGLRWGQDLKQGLHFCRILEQARTLSFLGYFRDRTGSIEINKVEAT